MQSNSIFSNSIFTEKTWNAFLQYGKDILLALLVLAVGLVLTKLILKVARKLLDKSSVDESVYKFLLNTVKYAAYVVIFVVVLTCLHVPTAPLVTVLGAGGAAIALAMKDSLGNIAGGIIILVNRPFVKGDFIEVAGTSGIVQSIDLMVTTLRTYDYKTVAVPNGTVTASVLINHTKEPLRRADFKFGVGYESDLTKVREILLAIADTCEDVLKDPQPFFGVSEYGDSAVEIEFKVWCETPKYWDVIYYIREQVKIAFEEADINIPYPQMDIHVIK